MSSLSPWAVEPGLISTLLRQGAALRQAGRSNEAMALYWQALALDASRLEICLEAGITLHDLGRRAEALAALRAVLDRAATATAAESPIAATAADSPIAATAADSPIAATAADSPIAATAAGAWIAAGLISTGRETREAAFRRAAFLAPDNEEAWRRLGETLSSQAPEQALGVYTTLLGLSENDPAGHRGMGEALLRLGRADEAKRALVKALEFAPTDPLAHAILAALHLSRGEALDGWRHLAHSRAAIPSQACTEWEGGDPAGTTITVIADGGLDDVLPLLAVIPLLADRGATVTLTVPAAWLPAMSEVKGVAAVRAQGRIDGPAGPVIALSRLPWRLGLTEAQPPVGRLTCPPDKGPRLAVPVGTRLKVGLLWAAGQSDEMSIGLEPLLPLTGLAGIRFYGLQTGPRAQDLRTCADPALITDLSAGLRDLGDLAGAVAQLDLVITVDGPMAPLARALGIPAWLLLPLYPDRRWWAPDGQDIRLFRQSRAGDWRVPVGAVKEALAAWVRNRPVPPGDAPDLIVDSLFPDADGKPRFRMTAPRSFLADPGIRTLVARERSGVGYEYATRCFIDAHIRPGDLFLDIGAHWGIMSLQAATRWPGKVKVLAVEPAPHNLAHLRRWVADNAVAQSVEVVGAFAAEAPGRGRLTPQSTMGHSLIRAENGTIPVVTVDRMMADRPALGKAENILVKIDVEGHEPAVIEGMKTLLAAGKVAAVIWERGREYDTAAGQERLRALRDRFDAWGFSAWRFESEDQAGRLVPFVEDGRQGNIFELRAEVRPHDVYGAERPTPVAQPADPALDAALRSRTLFAQGLAAHRTGKTAAARDLYRQAAALDGTQSGPYNNLGALLRTGGRRAAAAASFERALRLAPGDVGVMSNCANALREIGAFAEAEPVLRQALALKPHEAGVIYNLGVLRKDTGWPREAVALFERALLLADDPDYRWDRALALLQAGDYRAGFDAYEARWGLKRAARRKIPLPVWDGSPLAGRSLFLSDEQGFGDVLQWARFVAPLKALGAGRIVLECQPELMRLMGLLPEVDAVVPRARQVPDCDVTAPLLSLPSLFGTTLETLPTSVPYLRAPPPSYRLPEDGRLKLGLVWAGKPTPRDRSIGLEMLLPLLGDPRIAAYSLQLGPRSADIARLGAELLITDLAPHLTDFAETAALLKQLDLLITVDTAVAHLAGALGVKTFLLLRTVSDWRWFDHRTCSPWYPTMTLFRQKDLDQWDTPLAGLRLAVEQAINRS